MELNGFQFPPMPPCPFDPSEGERLARWHEKALSYCVNPFFCIEPEGKCVCDLTKDPKTFEWALVSVVDKESRKLICDLTYIVPYSSLDPVNKHELTKHKDGEYGVSLLEKLSMKYAAFVPDSNVSEIRMN